MITRNDILNNEVRALSFKQPYADLMLRGKQETRKRPTRYRGLVLICASKVSYDMADVFNISGEEQEKRIRLLYDVVDLETNDVEPYKLTGVAIGLGRLINCRPMVKEDENKTFVKFNSELFVYEFKEVVPVVPFGWKGNQGWKILTPVEKSLIVLNT